MKSAYETTLFTVILAIRVVFLTASVDKKRINSFSTTFSSYKKCLRVVFILISPILYNSDLILHTPGLNIVSMKILRKLYPEN